MMIDCKTVLQPIRLTTTDGGQFIKDCQNVGTEQHRAALLAAALKGEIKCFNCVKAGHTQKECRNKNKKPPMKDCPHCHKGKHWANQCRSTYDKDGTLLPPLQGNEKRGASSGALNPRRSSNNSNQLLWAQEDAGSPTFAPPQGGVRGWTWSPPPNSS